MENVKLFDRIFKPEVIQLENGKTITRNRSRLPLILACLTAVIVAAIMFTGFELDLIIRRIDQLSVIFGQIMQPDWSYLDKVIGPLIDTIKMSLVGTFVGVIIGLPVAILASSNINKNKVVVSVLRLVLGIVRTVPTLIMATIFSLIFGLGTFAGTVAICLFTFGIVTKMLFESIETIDLGPFDALMSMGCNRFEAFWAGCMPQILPTYLSHSLYCFEVNIRAAAILGYVGAGGLGILINERIGWRDYNSLGTILITLFIAVLCIEQMSAYIRRKLV